MSLEGVSFSGLTELNVDEKGRIAIPAAIRAQLMEIADGSLVLTMGFDGCLMLYPEPQFRQIQAALMSKPANTKSRRMMQRMVVGHAQPVTMDAQGRIRISAELRKQGKIDKQVNFVGMGGKYEIWAVEQWSDEVEEWMQDDDAREKATEEVDTIIF